MLGNKKGRLLERSRPSHYSRRLLAASRSSRCLGGNRLIVAAADGAEADDEQSDHDDLLHGCSSFKRGDTEKRPE